MKLRSYCFALIFLLFLASCNVFSPFELARDHLDRCKGLNDAARYEDAMEECQKAIDLDSSNMEAHLEFADASFSSLGINILSISDVFLKPSDGTSTIVRLAESILRAGKIDEDERDKGETIKILEDAVDAFDNYGAILISETPGANGKQIANFYSMLARLCYLSIIMAYADIESPNPDGLIRKSDICTSKDCEDFICKENCGGMAASDAKRAGELIRDMKNYLSDLGLGDVQKVVEDMSSIKVYDPEKTSEDPKVPIDQIEGYDEAVGRQILFEITD